MNEIHRQSGRTTRMLEDACRAAYVGRAVYILVHSHDAARYLEKHVNATWEKMTRPGAQHGIKVESMTQWDHHGQWNWHKMQPYGNPHPNCLFLVDHHAVELKLEQVHAEIQSLATLAGKLYPHTV